jgi:hypothetical protein
MRWESYYVAHTLPSPSTIEEAQVLAKMARANVTLDAKFSLKFLDFQ